MAKATKSSENQSVKKDALQTELEKIEKDFGKGSMLNCDKYDYDVISTGSLKLDLASGIGGLARGKVVEFIGWESSGKSTTALHIIANAQNKYPELKCLLLDGENAFDPNYATSLGVDVENLLKFQGDEGGGERAYDVAERLMKTKRLSVLVIDSQTSLLPKKIFDDPNDASNLGLHARLMSRIVPKLTMLAAAHNVLVIFVSQFREKIGVMWGSPETTNGGNALRFYAHQRLEFRKSVLSDDEKNAYANKTKVKFTKNKLAAPFKSAEFNIRYGEGVDTVLEIFDLAIEYKIIEKAGSWYSYKGTSLGQGEDSVLTLLRDNPEYLINLKKKVLEVISAPSTGSNEPQGDIATVEEIQGAISITETTNISSIEPGTIFNNGTNTILATDSSLNIID